MSTEPLNFPASRLGKYLKCSDCRNYLSVPPVVVLKDTGAYKCGRCVHTGLPPHPRKFKYKTAARDLAYEELAKDLRFPCKNQHLGCKAREPFRELALHEGACNYANVPCPILHCQERLCDPESTLRHFQHYHWFHGFDTNNTYQTCIFTVPKDFEGLEQKKLFVGKVVFIIAANKTVRQVSFKIRSFCSKHRYNFSIKPINFKASVDDSEADGKNLLSSPGKANSSVKFEVDASVKAEEYRFQVQVLGKVKEKEEFVKTPTGESEILKCVKCNKFLSTKPVMLTKQGLECGRCVKLSAAKDAVRMKAYEILAKSVLFPCDQPKCGESFSIEEMKKHTDGHKNVAQIQ